MIRRKRNTTRPEEVVQNYAFSNYGNLILIDNPVFDDEERVYVSNIRSDYPLMIKDDRDPERRRMHILKIDTLGTLALDQELQILKDRTTSRDECIKNLGLFFQLWKRRAEEIIVGASSDYLVRISRFRHFFDPIDSILLALWDNQKICDVEIDFARLGVRRKKIRLYLKLLEGLELVREIDDGYAEGNAFVSLRHEITDERKFRDKLLSLIIKERYPTLRDIFKLTILEPTIHVDSSIYIPELEVEGSVYRSMESIKAEYEYYYERKINTLDLRLILERLEEAQAIKREGKYYSGNEELLGKMLKVKRNLPPLSIKLLTHA